jgi:hypothetical protein
LSQSCIKIALAREANQFAASSPRERSDMREMTKAPDVATLIRAARSCPLHS